MAAERAGKSPGTIRNWRIEHGIGRRVGGGQWIVSKVALALFLDGDDKALRRYKAGDRSEACVVAYFRSEGLIDVVGFISAILASIIPNTSRTL